MTRRAAAGFGRLLPLLLIAAALVIVAGAALLAACGGSSGGASPGPTATVTVTPSGSATATASPSASPSAAPAETTIRLYFLRDEKLGVAERRVAHTTMPATAAMKALLAGPTAAETSRRADQHGAGGHGAPGPHHLRLDRARRPLRRLRLRRRQPVDDGPRGAGRLHAHPVPHRALRGVPHRRQAGRGAGRRRSPARARPRRRADWRSFEPAIFVESPGRRRRGLQPVHPLGHGQRLRGHVPGTSRRLVRAAAS